jgi:hypothetical protein
MSWVTAEEKSKSQKIQEIKAQLSELDTKLPRWAETAISKDADAMAEIIDGAGTARGDVLEKKKELREKLKAL